MAMVLLGLTSCLSFRRIPRFVCTMFIVSVWFVGCESRSDDDRIG